MTSINLVAQAAVGLVPQAVTQSPRVSVLLTTLNPDPKYFPQAVSSILAQSMSDFELVIIEAYGSRPGRHMLPTSDDRIRYFVMPHPTNLVGQKNYGLERVNSEYVAIMDGDDIAHPDRLQQQFDLLVQNPAISVVGCQIAAIDLHDHVIGFRKFPTTHDQIAKELSVNVPFCHPSAMIRRRHLMDVGGYRDIGYSTCEDFDLWARLFAAGAMFANLPDVLFYYRIHSQQMKFTHLRDTMAAFQHVRKLHGLTPQVKWYRSFAELVLRCLPQRLAYSIIIRTLYHSAPPDPMIGVHSVSVPPVIQASS